METKRIERALNSIPYGHFGFANAHCYWQILINFQNLWCKFVSLDEFWNTSAKFDHSSVGNSKISKRKQRRRKMHVFKDGDKKNIDIFPTCFAFWKPVRTASREHVLSHQCWRRRRRKSIWRALVTYVSTLEASAAILSPNFFLSSPQVRQTFRPSPSVHIWFAFG